MLALNNTKTIIFRCDQNNISGFGHFSRCLNFARLLIEKHQFKPLFIGNFCDFSIKLLKKYEIDFKLIEKKDFSYFEKSLFSQYDYMVIDSYLYEQDFINKVIKLPLFTVFIDDECILDYTDVDLVINFRVGYEEAKYKSKKKALGSNYFIFKPEFLKIRERKINSNKTTSVLLFFGGLELVKSYANSVIESINEIDEKINIYYLSDDFSYLSENNRNKIIELKPTFEIEKILNLVDCVINGGGLIKYECVFCKIPSASLSTTKLQYEDTLILKNKKMIFDLGFVNDINKRELKQNVKDFILNNKVKEECINASETYFTENSVDNIIKLMI
jgi:spore coat polysaccharide biosynthesis predicted glycosyltransferase SpsG